VSKNNFWFNLILIFFAVLIIYSNSYSQKHITFFGAGITNIIGEGSENLDMGKNFTVLSLVKSTDLIYVGGKFGYNTFDFNSEVENSSASLTIYEFLPLIRIFPAVSADKSITGFFQFGFGFYNISSKIGSKNTLNSIVNSQDKPGINLGMGILLGASSNGLQLEVAPNYNIIFTEDESSKYYTINFGLVYNM